MPTALPEVEEPVPTHQPPRPIEQLEQLVTRPKPAPIAVQAGNRVGLWIGLGLGVSALVLTTIGSTRWAVGYFSSTQNRQTANFQEVVGQLGLPDETAKHYISWPESQEIDGIFYSPDVGDGIATEHWKYKTLPGAVIAIVGNSTSGWVWCVGTHRDKVK